MKFLTPCNLDKVPTVLAIFSIAVLFHASSALVSSNRHSLPKIHHQKNAMRFATSDKDGDGKETIDKITESDLTQQQFKRVTWNPLRLMVLKLGLTEPAWTSPLNYGKRDGIYNCAYCGLGLFDTSGYYDSGSGWPSFWRSVENGHVRYKKEWDGRLECVCGRCSSHLGHVFLDGPLPRKVPEVLFQTAPPSDPRGRRADGYLPRFCVNGASLTFEKKSDGEEN